MGSKLIIIIGPTASGKTALSIELARKLSNGAGPTSPRLHGAGIVSADSRQVYVGMNIGTAKPRQAWYGAKNKPHDKLQPDIVDGVPHYLLNIRQPDDPITLAEWQQAAFDAIDSLYKQQMTPLLVGGTMLYVDSVALNYSLPRVPPNNDLREQLDREPTYALYQRLVVKDPTAAEFIEPSNKRRIIRALEVMDATGQPFSSQRRQREPRYQLTMIGLKVEWSKLKQRITDRAQAMISDGLLLETEQLIARFGRALPLLKTINYEQAAAVLSGEMTPDEAIEAMVRVNMRYARRQMSWWRGRSDIHWIDEADVESVAAAL